VLVVDDIAENRELIAAMLASLGCQVSLAASGPEALESVSVSVPDLVLLDVQMPGMDGLEVCRRLRAQPAARLLPVVMVTALNAVEDRVSALEAGADDFLTKPVARVELVARVSSLLRLKALYDTLEESERVIYSLARAVEAKDTYTEAHTIRVAATARELGQAAGLPDYELGHLYRGGVLHDVGKIGVPDWILLKPGSLDASEVAIMQRHPEIGEDIVRPLRSAEPLLAMIRHHHERFDGHGYPDSLAGEEIPLTARVIAICDAFDALTTDRPYRPAWSEEAAIEILRRGAGSQWDAELVAVFNSLRRASPFPPRMAS
jgi:putative two-component system response regulator